MGAYFEVATDASWRERSRRFEGLSRAGAVVLVTTRPQDYVERYAEPDKVASGLSEFDAWPLPYWHADAAMATMSLLLLLEESDWQATLWGSFRRDEEVLAWASIAGEELFASVLIGRADGNDVTSRSLERSVPTRRDRVRRVEPLGARRRQCLEVLDERASRKRRCATIEVAPRSVRARRARDI